MHTIELLSLYITFLKYKSKWHSWKSVQMHKQEPTNVLQNGFLR